jgi:hypothetical protein
VAAARVQGVDMTAVAMGVLAQPWWDRDCDGAMAKRELANWPISDNNRLTVHTRKKSGPPCHSRGGGDSPTMVGYCGPGSDDGAAIAAAVVVAVRVLTPQRR